MRRSAWISRRLFAGWEADQPVWAGDVDRMFVSLVAPGYDGTDGALAAPAEGWAEVSEIACEGSGSVLAIGDGQLPEHRLRIATGYDDLYHLTPARVLRNALRLGYRGLINHYVGMSHYAALEDGLAASGLNAPCAAWHADFLARAKALGFEVILSLSYELLAQHCPDDWKQRAENGEPALTGWEPPSALLSPCNDEAMAWLQGIARAFVALAVGGGDAGAVSGRRAVVVGDGRWADLPLRRGGGGGVRSGFDSGRAGRARCGAVGDAGRCGGGAGGLDGGLVRRGAGRGAGGGMPAARLSAGRSGRGRARQCAAWLGAARFRCAAARGL